MDISDLERPAARQFAPWTDAADMFRTLARDGAQRPVFRRRGPSGWIDTSWRDLGEAAAAFGLAALSRGLKPGDTVAILAKTRPEWMIADLGCIGAGLVAAGIYPTEPPDKVAYVLNDCRARAIFVDDAEQVAKVLAIRAQCPNLETVIVLDPQAAPPGDEGFVALATWLLEGRSLAELVPDAWREAGQAVRPGDVAILIYTSGTTGPPKGAKITQGNIAYQVRHGVDVFRMKPDWIRPAFLPLCHVAERMFTYFTMAAGMTSVFVDGPSQLVEALPDVRPEFLLAVPRVYEKLHAAAQAWIEAQPDDRRAALRLAQAGALAASDDPNAPLAAADLLEEILSAVGLDRGQVLLSGGARFPGELARWYRAFGAPVRELYGMTECGTVAVNFDLATAAGVVGAPCGHGDVRLAETGEILVRGPHVFAGYLNLPEKSAEVLREGWYHTGDVGRFDAEGRLVLLDRLKDIIISSSGKNITPSEVEGALKASPYIADAVAIGEGRHYLTALVIIDGPAVAQALAAGGEHPDGFAALAASPTTRTLVAEAITTANKGLSRPESVKQFRIVPSELGATDEAMTPTLKIKRRVLADRYADLIEDMYRQAAPAKDRA